ncbi:MAG: LysR family transcriptional regulator substrate-binding protein, partial [Acidimicrobiia bacterium]
RPTVAVETAHRDAIAALVRSGSGYAIVPRNVAERNLDPAVRIVPIRPAITRRVGLVHRWAPLSPAGQAFIELIAARPHPARQ